MYVCMFLSVFDEHNSFADQQHAGYGYYTFFYKEPS